jgi:aminocarboxymuconate-semialdehyde decarboxylase
MYFDTVSDSVDALRCACESLGSDRLLFGTDYPYGNEARIEHRLSYLDEVGLEAAEVDRIRGSRASALLLDLPDD